MARFNWGERMPSTYLEVLKPTPGVTYRFAILSMDLLVATQAHWVETPFNTKGMYECTGGKCCASGLFPNGPIQNYAVPIWLYLNPPNFQNGDPGSNEGILKILRMPPGLYDLLVTLSQSLDLMLVDLLAVAQPSGKGTKTSLFQAQGETLLTPEMRQQLMGEIGDIGSQIERSLMRACSEQDWDAILLEYQGVPSGNQAGIQPQATVRPVNPSQMFGGQALGAGQQRALPPGQGSVQQRQAAPAQQRQAAPMAQRPSMALQGAATGVRTQGAVPAGVVPGARQNGVGPQVRQAAAPQVVVPGARPQGTIPGLPRMVTRPPVVSQAQAGYQEGVPDDGSGVETMSEDEVSGLLGDGSV